MYRSSKRRRGDFKSPARITPTTPTSDAQTAIDSSPRQVREGQKIKSLTGTKIRDIEFINSKASHSWGNKRRVDLTTLLKRCNNASAYFLGDEIDIGEDSESWVKKSDIVDAILKLIEEKPSVKSEEIREILSRLNGEEFIFDTDEDVLEGDSVMNEATPSKKRNLSNGKEPPKKRTFSSKEKYSKESREKAAKEAEFEALDFSEAIVDKREDTTYMQKGTKRVFLVDAPNEVLDLYGESGRLIKEGRFLEKGEEGENPEQRYIDFADNINRILDNLLEKKVDKSTAIKALKISNEWLNVIHDYLLRQRSKKYAEKYGLEVRKVKKQIDALNRIIDSISVAIDLKELGSLIKEARSMFGLAYGLGVRSSIHPGDFIGGPLEVNQFNRDSFYKAREGETGYAKIFVRTRNLRTELNAKYGDIENFSVAYLADSIIATVNEIATQMNITEERVVKLFGIGLTNYKKLKTLRDKKADDDPDFSDHFADSDDENAREATLKRENDTISNFVPYLTSLALFSKQMNEIVLLRQDQLDRQKKKKKTRLLRNIKNKRSLERRNLGLFAEDSKLNIAMKLNALIKPIDLILKECDALGKKKTVEEILEPHKKKGLMRLNGVKEALAKSKDVKALKVNLKKLKESLMDVKFSAFMKANTKKGKSVYEYNRSHKFSFLKFNKELSIILEEIFSSSEESSSTESSDGESSSSESSDGDSSSSESSKSDHSSSESSYSDSESEETLIDPRLRAFFASLVSDPVNRPEDGENADRADHSRSAADFMYASVGSSASKGKVEKMKIEWFKRKPNVGGGDCLLHALESRNLSSVEVAALRSRIADNLDGIVSPTVSNGVFNSALRESGYYDANKKTLDGIFRHKDKLSINSYKEMVKLPRLYLGESEIRSYCKINRCEVYIVTSEGELRKITGTTSRTIFLLKDVGRGNFLDKVAKKIDSRAIVLYKTPGHWERILSLN